MPPTSEAILQALRAIKYPGYSRDIVSFGIVKDVAATEDLVRVRVHLTTPSPEVGQQIHREVEIALRQLPGVKNVQIDITVPAGGAAPATPGMASNRISGVKRVIAVASGKGGVGKSTTSVNLACALQHLGAKVGLLDCDIYGPSVPLMMGTRDRPAINEEEKLVPPEAHGIKLMSMGFLLDGDSPVIWRGPMITKTIQQFLFAVAWGELDYLLVDLPPGTGDAQLSLCQSVPLDGGVIVTTPQEASLGVVRKGIAMFEKVNVPILGMVENMSYFTAPGGERVEIFGHGGGKLECHQRGITFLGEVPIFTEIRLGGDLGVPVVVSGPETAPGKAFLQVAEALKAKFK